MIKKRVRRIYRKFKRKDDPNRKVVTLNPINKTKGSVLLSYVIDPFLVKQENQISYDHTHDWESFQIAQTFVSHGYSVDVISYLNNAFIPKKHYSYFISARTNFDRIVKDLNPNCIKVVHLDTAHWLHNNSAAYQRLISVQRRRGFTLDNIKMVESNRAIENADIGTVLGNQFTIDTYAYAGKPIYRIPISTPVLYSWDGQKDFNACKNKFLWFGSSGFVHKGLDLVLEAFSQMPNHYLTICGPLEEEQEFAKAYNKELFETSNIKTIGWVDITSKEFKKIINDCVALIYPTCSEGGGGSVLTCMHGGLIPIVSYESSVDIEPFGVLLNDCTISEIQNAVNNFSKLSVEELEKRAHNSWKSARNKHTRDSFKSEYNKFVTEVLFKWKS